MVTRWMAYLAALAAALLFHGIYNQYYSYLLLLLVLFAPPVSLLVSLPGFLLARAEIIAVPSGVTCATEGMVEILFRSHWILPVACVRMNVRLCNDTLTTPEQLFWVRKYCFYRENAALPILLEHIGSVSVQVEHARIYDYFGLFFVPMKKKPFCRFDVLPAAERPARLPSCLLGEETVKAYRPKPGAGFSEEYDLRDYRPGDPINLIHWKLTEKRDSFIVREPLEVIRKTLLLSFHAYGTPRELDSVLGQLVWLARRLDGEAIAYSVRVNFADGHSRIYGITALQELFAFLHTLYAFTLPRTGKESAAVFSAGEEIHLAAREGAKE